MNIFRFILFILISSTVAINNVWGFGGTSFLGLSLKNAVFFSSFIVLFLMSLSSKKVSVVEIPSIIPLCIFVVIATFSIFYSKLFSAGIKLSTITSLTEYKSKLIDPVFLYIAGCIIFNKKSNILTALKVLVVFYALMNILALLSFLTGHNLIGKAFLSHRGQRFSSFFSIANQGAYALSFILPLLYYYLIDKKHFINKVLFSILSICCIGGVLLTGSRGAYLLVPVQVVGFSLLTKNIRLFLFTIISGFLFALLLFILNPDFVTSALDRMLLFKASNLSEVSSGRTMVWQGLLQIISNQPLAAVTGVGWGTYREHLINIFGMAPAAHNYYLKVWIEVGVVGLCILLFGVANYIYKFRRMIRSSSPLLYQCCIFSFLALFWNTMLASLETYMLYYAWFIGLMTNFAIIQYKEIRQES